MPLTAVPYAKYADLADSAIHAGHSTSADFSDSVSITWLENYLSGSNISTQQQSDWLQTNTEAVDFIKNKPTLATVATSGSYNDLTDKPNKAALCDSVSDCINNALDDYATKDYVDDLLDGYVTDDALALQLEDYATEDYVADYVDEHAGVDLSNYATKDTLNYYEKKEDLCKDVKECIKDTLSYYTTTAGLNNLLNTKADATDLDALKTRVNTFNTHICDSISSCMTSYTAAAQAALQLQLQDYATKAKVKQDSIDLGALIDQNRTDITNLNSDLDKLAERVDTNNKHICDSVEACVTGWIHDSIEDLKKSDNYFSGNNIFGHDQQGEGTEPTITSFGGVVYVPSAEIDLKNTPYEDRCGTATFDQAVNVCDLLAVFDSLNRSIKGVYDSLKKTIDSLKERIAILENASSDVPPVGNILDLDTVTVNHVVADGWTITGTLDVTHHPVKISIADGATVTLKNVTINGVNSSSYAWAGITCEGDATLVLNGTNTVKGFYEDYPGLYVKATTNPFEDKTLTINGPGSLTVSSNGCCSAGIGGGYNIECGNIVILGGTINATGGSNAAGIGSSQGGVAGRCGNITIEGGSITATGGSESGAAGIGCGDSGRCGDITITDGVTKVVATKGNDAAPTFIGKGVGSTSACGTVKICNNTFIGGVTTSSSESVPSPFSYSYTGNTWTLTK